jgi:hypothetical protein
VSALPSQADLLEVFGPLADEKPGAEYATAELLPTYNAWAGEHDRPALTAQVLGMVLAREVTLDRRTKHKAAVWRLTRAGLECRNWHR